MWSVRISGAGGGEMAFTRRTRVTFTGREEVDTLDTFSKRPLKDRGLEEEEEKHQVSGPEVFSQIILNSL
jgi:hypothetical protein